MASPIPLVIDGETRFIARQPILDRKQQIYGYELLFRSGADVSVSDTDSETATRATLDLSLLLGADSFTDGRPAFINCGRESLLSGTVSTLPKELVILEILETVPADQDIVRECRRLKKAGYKFALDDIVSTTDRLALFEFADIIKVDFLLTDHARQQAIVQRFCKRGVQLLAEKVETHEQYRSAIAMGYSLFQGYFFCRPVTMEARDLPSAQVGYLDVLRKVYQPEFDIPAIARAIRQEPALYYRLLRYMNSAAFGFNPVHSIVHALNLLGCDELRKWVSLVATISLAGPRSAALIRMALERARFCELVAQHMNLPTADFFLTGLFSLLDAILNRPLTQIVEQIPISAPCRDALTGVPNQQKRTLDFAASIASGQWEDLPQFCDQVGCTELEACQWQFEAQRWVHAVLAKEPPATQRV